MLYQALHDFRERFGSPDFQRGWRGYLGPAERGCFLDDAGVVCGDGDWGVQHRLEEVSAGVATCEVFDSTVVQRQVFEIEEENVGSITVSFANVSLPTGAILIARQFPDTTPYMRIEGPFESSWITDGPLYARWATGHRITLAAIWENPPGGCRPEPMFTVRGWRHRGGTIADRQIVWGAAHVANGYVDWYDLRVQINAADRVLYPAAAMNHEGWFFHDAFWNHGIDDIMVNSTCEDHPCWCHDWWWLDC